LKKKGEYYIMKILISKNSIYFCGKIKDIKEELNQYKNSDFSVKDLIRIKLS